jgi:hypothetical protein
MKDLSNGSKNTTALAMLAAGPAMTISMNFQGWFFISVGKKHVAPRLEV